ncbi:MAG: helix-turn-helix transcriptional regulator [Nitrospirota bacterium]|jgi:transcriptional regulator with XRE-family HTH domain
MWGKLKALTQEELGERAGLSYKFVGEIERGKVNPSLDSIVRIAEALGVKAGDLFPHEADIFPILLKTSSLSKKPFGF